MSFFKFGIGNSNYVLVNEDTGTLYVGGPLMHNLISLLDVDTLVEDQDGELYVSLEDMESDGKSSPEWERLKHNLWDEYRKLRIN